MADLDGLWSERVLSMVQMYLVPDFVMYSVAVVAPGMIWSTITHPTQKPVTF